MTQRARFFAALSTWALLFLASPGILSRDGSVAIAFIALVPWALFCSREGPRAFWIEWLAAAIGLSAMCIWSTFVWWGTLIAVALVPAVYMAGAGVLLRRLARGLPLALAAPLAWVCFETLRSTIEPPFAFGWMRLGHHAHATAWLAGSARVWGVGGLSFVLAAFAGGVADLLRASTPFLNDRDATASSRSPTAGGQARHPVFALALALGPLALGIVLRLTTSSPPMQLGPRLMLVQPAFEQRRKMESSKYEDLFAKSCELTARGLGEAEHKGEPIPDLVAWGETMFPVQLAESDLLEAFDHGLRSPEWTGNRVERRWIEVMVDFERDWVGEVVLGVHSGAHAGLLPKGTSFLSGVEQYAAHEGEIRRQNAVIAWNADGSRAGVGGKIHLVPGAEQLCGLERFAFVRTLAFAVAGYVPDLVPFDRTHVIDLKARDGRTWRYGVTVCFDNAYEDPYVQPVHAGGLDFHLVVSNEAWYEESFEYDQMVAFSRLLAIETGRSFVRATNAGITVVIDPDGRDVARLESGAKDRMVAGTLRVSVPVPEGGSTAKPPYVDLARAWIGLWIGLPLALAFFSSRRVVTPVRDRDRSARSAVSSQRR